MSNTFTVIKRSETGDRPAARKVPTSTFFSRAAGLAPYGAMLYNRTLSCYLGQSTTQARGILVSMCRSVRARLDFACTLGDKSDNYISAVKTHSTTVNEPDALPFQANGWRPSGLPGGATLSSKFHAATAAASDNTSTTHLRLFVLPCCAHPRRHLELWPLVFPSPSRHLALARPHPCTRPEAQLDTRAQSAAEHRTAPNLSDAPPSHLPTSLRHNHGRRQLQTFSLAGKEANKWNAKSQVCPKGESHAQPRREDKPVGHTTLKNARVDVRHALAVCQLCSGSADSVDFDAPLKHCSIRSAADTASTYAPQAQPQPAH
ncbi:hypothetical protein Q7P37_006281 [Cladosporium fusiforme]